MLVYVGRGVDELSPSDFILLFTSGLLSSALDWVLSHVVSQVERCTATDRKRLNHHPTPLAHLPLDGKLALILFIRYTS